MRVHVLTLNWNGANMLDRLRQGLGHQLAYFYMKDGRVMDGWEHPVWHIRDNGSKDDSINTINRWEHSSTMGPLFTEIYEIGHNRDSFATCVNFLFEKANPADDDVVFLMNNDISFSPWQDTSFLPGSDRKPTLINMWRLQQKTNAGVVGCRLHYNDTNQLQHAGVIFSNRYNKMPFHYRPGEECDAQAKKNRYFQAVTAALCLVKPASFKRVGGMDETFRWAFEDVDLCLQIGSKEKIAYCGQAFAYHEESASLRKNPVNKMFMGQNAKYFKEKWLGKYDIDHDKYLNDPSYQEIQP
jgi:GT2 family glycosyltransferase